MSPTIHAPGFRFVLIFLFFFVFCNFEVCALLKYATFPSFRNVRCFVSLCVPGACVPGEVTFETLQGDVATDVVLVVDESSHTEGEHRWLFTMITDMEKQLIAAGIGTSSQLRNRYCQIGYGRTLPEARIFRSRLDGSICLVAERYLELVSQLIADGRGSKEDGYQAIDLALSLAESPLNELRLQPNVTLNMILLSDEDRDELYRQFTREIIERRLRELQFVLNVVVDHSFTKNGSGERLLGRDSSRVGYLQTPNQCLFTTVPADQVVVSKGYAGTREDYSDLAWALQGVTWDVEVLRRGDTTGCAFTFAFVEVTTLEILRVARQCRTCRCNDRGETICLREELTQNQCNCVVGGGTVSVDNGA